MTNHLHFFIQVGDTPLGMVMRDIASNYARAFQAKLDTTGHLFERRYYAKVVDVDTYLFAVLRYIHLNPVANGLVRCVNDYPWSSHGAYAGLSPPHAWLETDFVLSAFDQRRREAHIAYLRFMAQTDPGSDVPIIEAADGDILGRDDFTARVLNRPFKPRPPGPSLEQLIDEVCRKFDLTVARLRSPSREPGVVRARAWIAHLALKHGSASLSEIARFLGRDRATLRYAMRQHAAAFETAN